MFKLQSPSKFSPFDAVHLWGHFFQCSKQFLNSLILIPFSASTVFVPPLLHPQNVSLWGLFSSEGTKKCHREWDWVDRENGAQGLCHKNCWTLSIVWAGALINHPSWNGQTCSKSLQKIVTEAKRSLSQQCQLVHWYSWVPRTLT